MKTLYMTVGLPASGKSSWAKCKMSENPGAYKRVNKDTLRECLDFSKWSQDNEKFVLGVRDWVIESALNAGKHVIVDDTNLAPKHQERLRQLAKQCGAQLEVVDFTSVSVEECIDRDRKRPNYVGETVIRSMWKQFLAPKVEAVPYDHALPECIIVDIDGTVALMNGRGPFEWARVGEDSVNVPVAKMVQLVSQFVSVLFVSGRDECCREATEAWLGDYISARGYPLFMRPAGDMRDDRIVKREIYERAIKGKYNVTFVVDDRTKVVRQWREMGLPCFQVADGDF